MSEHEWTPTPDEVIPLTWPDRIAFISWLTERDKSIAADAVKREQDRAANERVTWMLRNASHVSLADRLLEKLRYDLARAIESEGL